MSDVFISWQDQIDCMYTMVESTGETEVETVRDLMSEHFRSVHPKYTSFCYDTIPKDVYDDFMEWLKEDD